MASKSMKPSTPARPRELTPEEKANRLCIRIPRHWNDPVWLRRLRGQYGADSREFDAKHPKIERMVDVLRARIAAQRKTIPQ